MEIFSSVDRNDICQTFSTLNFQSLGIMTPKTRRKHQACLLTFETISKSFTSPIERAAKEFGISKSGLQKQCRKIGISEWPYRKAMSIAHTHPRPKEVFVNIMKFLQSSLHNTNLLTSNNIIRIP